MNLPLINNDNSGNSYYGWRTNNFVYAPDSVGFTADKWQSWINGFFGQTCVDDQFRLILPASFESLSLPVSSSRWRFNNGEINTTNSSTNNSSIGYRVPDGGWGLTTAQVIGSLTRAHYAVLNNRSFSIVSTELNGGQLNLSAFSFASVGWLSNPLYSGIAFPRNAYYLFLQSNRNGINGSARISVENSSAAQGLQFPSIGIANSIANYPVSCQVATPGANTTELYLRDNIAPNKAIGYVPNLLKTSLQIPIGQIYRNTGIDPDGSNMNTWICVGNWGSERLLMRVWASGLG